MKVADIGEEREKRVLPEPKPRRELEPKEEPEKVKEPDEELVPA
jgi:hypothetical protein